MLHVNIDALQAFNCSVDCFLLLGPPFFHVEAYAVQQQLETIGNVEGCGADDDDEECGFLIPVQRVVRIQMD